MRGWPAFTFLISYARVACLFGFLSDLYLARGAGMDQRVVFSALFSSFCSVLSRSTVLEPPLRCFQMMIFFSGDLMMIIIVCYCICASFTFAWVLSHALRKACPRLGREIELPLLEKTPVRTLPLPALQATCQPITPLDVRK